MDLRTYGRTDPLIEMRGRIEKGGGTRLALNRPDKETKLVVNTLELLLVGPDRTRLSLLKLLPMFPTLHEKIASSPITTCRFCSLERKHGFADGQPP